MKQIYRIEVDCPHCAQKMEDAANRTPGVRAANVNFMAQNMTVEFKGKQPAAAVMSDVLKNCRKIEPDCQIYYEAASSKPSSLEPEQKKTLLRILAAAGLLILAVILPVAGSLRFLLYMASYLLVGYDILLKAFRGILNGRVFDENFLMAVATLGAIILAWSGRGAYTEAVAVMLLYQTGELFQSFAVERSRKNIVGLMDIRPEFATVEQDGRLIQTSPETVAVGTTILVRPGEKIPLDGVVLEGTSSLNTNALTGESLPRDAAPGDVVLSGCINLTGVLRVQTTKEFEHSTVSRILELVEQAGANKSRSEGFITRFARVYTPIVCFGALALAVLPPLVCMCVLGVTPNWLDWLYRALTFLVISCPCALVISIPLSFFAGIGGAGSVGILIKGANYLESLSDADTIVFDKTGTLTKGVFQVTAVRPVGMTESALLEYAALAESASIHPIAESIRSAYGKQLELQRVSEIREVAGEGVLARVDGRTVGAGNHKLMARFGLTPEAAEEPGSVVYVAVEDRYAGAILVSDQIKPGAKQSLLELKRLGVSKTVMLTGDNRASAEQTAAALGIDQVRSQLLPGEKVTCVEALLSEQTPGKHLAYVGDGINDAPVLTRADVGIAMGAMGSDAAIEAADIVLMDDDPIKVAKAVRIARKCMRIVRQNIVLAIGVKAVCLLLGALGYASMWLAIFADVGVMVLAVLNAVRALSVRKL